MQLPPLPDENVIRSIAVDYSEAEYVEFNLLVFRERVRAQVTWLVVIAAVLALTALLVPYDLSIPFAPATFVVAALTLIFALFYKESMKSNVRQLFRSPGSTAVIKRATTIDSLGVTQEGHDGSRSFVPWSSITEVREGPLTICLLLNSQFGYIVPKRGFPSMQEAESFADFARSRVRLLAIDKPKDR